METAKKTDIEKQNYVTIIIKETPVRGNFCYQEDVENVVRPVHGTGEYYVYPDPNRPLKIKLPFGLGIKIGHHNFILGPEQNTAIIPIQSIELHQGTLYRQRSTASPRQRTSTAELFLLEKDFEIILPKGTILHDPNVPGFEISLRNDTPVTIQ